MKTRLLAFTLGLCLAAFGAFGQPVQLQLADVQTIIAQAVTRAAQISPNSVIAVVDREGFVLGVWSVNGAPPATAIMANAMAKAGTASFLSSDQHAFSTRTAGFIVQQNFPPGLMNSGPGPLVGVNFSNLQFSDINRLKVPGTNNTIVTNVSNPGATNYIMTPVPIPITGGLAGSPGGVPLYINGYLVGGVGVAHIDDAAAIQVEQVATVDEDVALAGEIGYAPDPVYFGSNVTINGFRLAYVVSTTSLGAVIPFGSLPGINIPAYPLTSSPPLFPYPKIVLGGLTNEIRQPIVNDPLPGNITQTVNGTSVTVGRLSSNDVTSILALAANRARTTRAGIRLPRGQPMQVFITVVNNPNADGVAPTVLGTIRTPGATMFSWDVAVQKARTALFFSSTSYGFSVRAVGFLAQELYPPGINGTEPGIFWGMQERFSLFTNGVMNPLDGVTVTSPLTVPDPNLPNGITIFPGGFPLYSNGVVVGAIGVSGDGVDQDDLVAASGTQNFLAPVPIRSDQYFYSGARLPYAKFPRNPAL